MKNELGGMYLDEMDGISLPPCHGGEPSGLTYELYQLRRLLDPRRVCRLCEFRKDEPVGSEGGTLELLGIMEGLIILFLDDI
jgi:hypothetical protein